MLKVKVAALKHNIEKAQRNKLFKNFSVCGFFLVPPRSSDRTSVMYNANLVGYVQEGKLVVLKFNTDHWGRDTYKYDILCEIQHGLHPEEVNNEKNEEEDKLKGEGDEIRTGNDKPVQKPKPVSKRKVKQKRK